MPYHCVAYGCFSTTDSGATLYRFPRDPEEFRKWEKQVQRTRSNWTASHASRLCSEHFGKDYFEPKQPLKLKEGAVPTVFLRPRCSSCEGRTGGCAVCIPSIQRKSVAEAPLECDTEEAAEGGVDDKDGQDGEEEEMNGATGAVGHTPKPTGAVGYTPEAGSKRDSARDCELAVCEMCGASGLRSSFYSSSRRFCKLKCSRAYATNARKATIEARGKGKSKKKKVQKVSAVQQLVTPKAEDFDWGSYLKETGCLAAPVSCFRHSPLCREWDDISVGLKVEVQNTLAVFPTRVYWIATIVQLAGYKALLRYDGFQTDRHDFWCSLCSGEIHAIGWCAMAGKLLVPPQVLYGQIQDFKAFLMKKLVGKDTVPTNLMLKLSEDLKSEFRPGMHVEVVDRTMVSRTQVAVINSVVGGRLRLVYKDQDPSELVSEFCCHTGSPLLHPIGWSKEVGHAVKPGGNTALLRKAGCAAGAGLFKKQRHVYVNGRFFEAGMKLEAIDPLNLGHICVATVQKVLLDGYLMISIDGQSSDDGSDWFCYHASSHAILPMGFCHQNDIPLTIPPGCDEVTWTWPSYLEETGARSAPRQLFNTDFPGHGFHANMKLEAVDLMVPHLVCVATVRRCVGRLMLVHFDGWESKLDQWVDVQSPDIYPVGWCEVAGHELSPPPGPDPPPEDTHAKKQKLMGKTKKKVIRNKLADMVKNRPPSRPSMQANTSTPGPTFTLLTPKAEPEDHTRPPSPPDTSASMLLQPKREPEDETGPPSPPQTSTSMLLQPKEEPGDETRPPCPPDTSASMLLQPKEEAEEHDSSAVKMETSEVSISPPPSRVVVKEEPQWEWEQQDLELLIQNMEGLHQ